MQKNLHLRIHNILNLNYNRKKQVCSTIFNLCIVLVTGIACLIFVPETYEISESDAQVSVKLTEDNSYLIEMENGYDLYIDANYMTTLTELPKTIALKVYKEGER